MGTTGAATVTGLTATGGVGTAVVARLSGAAGFVTGAAAMTAGAEVGVAAGVACVGFGTAGVTSGAITAVDGTGAGVVTTSEAFTGVVVAPRVGVRAIVGAAGVTGTGACVTTVTLSAVAGVVGCATTCVAARDDHSTLAA